MIYAWYVKPMIAGVPGLIPYIVNLLNKLSVNYRGLCFEFCPRTASAILLADNTSITRLL